jgi:hypothetical protein
MIDLKSQSEETRTYMLRLVEIARTLRTVYNDKKINVSPESMDTFARFTADVNFLTGYILAIDPLPVEKVQTP